MERSEIAELRRLVERHPGAPGSSRLRQIILDRRPAFTVDPLGIAHVPDQLPDIAPSDRAPLIEKIPEMSKGVGLIVAELGGGAGGERRIGTAFRVEGAPRRMLTCRHNLEGMLLPEHRIKQSRPLLVVAPGRAAPLPPGQGLWPCRVDFPFGSRRINPNILWAHPAFDLMVFDLAPAAEGEPVDDALSPLAVETNRQWGSEKWGDAVAVIGFPLDAPENAPPFHPFTEGLGKLYVSLGKRNHDPGLAERAATVREDIGSGTQDFQGEHDASTYRGHSGSPVVALATGRVLGVHVLSGAYQGSGNADKGNGYVQIAPALDREDALCHDILGVGDPTAVVRWSPPFSGHERGPVESGADLEATLLDASGLFFSTVIADMPDPRDALYRPAFSFVPDRLLPAARDLPPLRAQRGPVCVGHAIATALDIALATSDRIADTKSVPRHPVSARMLDETARLFDEYADDRLGGSSLRGGLKGLFHSGVCPEEPESSDNAPWFLTRKRAEASREVRLTAYYRLHENISDIQHAVATTGAVLMSAHVHDGWRRDNANGRIPWPHPRNGRHAFVIIGYDRDGWYVRNSWGLGWSSVRGRQGVALWTYEDWRENMIDAWVLQLAPRTPKAFEVPAWVAEASRGEGDTQTLNTLARLPLPRRHSLIGHAMQVERDQVIEGGRLGLGLNGLRETALYLRSGKARGKYRRIAILCHDPFLGSDDVARISGEVVGPMKRDGIYSINLAYGLNEAETIRLRIAADAARLAKRTIGSREDATAYLLRVVARSASPLMRVFREGLDTAVQTGGPLWQFMVSLCEEIGFAEHRGRERELLLISLGAGGLVSDALSALFSQRYAGGRMRRVDVASLRGAATAPGARDILVPLSEKVGRNTELHGFRADWSDLVGRAVGLSPHRDPSGTFSNSADLYAEIIRMMRTTRFSAALDESDPEAAYAVMKRGGR